MKDGELVVVTAEDSVLRDFVAHFVARCHRDFDFLDCDLTRRFCLRLLEDPTELRNKSFVWELPLPARSLRYYEELFIEHVLLIVRKLPCVVVVAYREGYLPKYIKRMCTQMVMATFRNGAIDCRCYDYCDDSRWRYLISLECEK